MDLHVRYCDVNEKKEFNLTKLIQISIDDLNSNLKFQSEIKKLRIKDELASLIDIGSCNFHDIHGEFKTCSESANWSLHKVLKVSFTLLHDAPSSQDDYFNMTGSSECSLKFCQTRWVKDKRLAEKLIKLWSNMIKVFDYWNSLCISKQPRLKSYENTKKGIEDPSDFGRASLVHLLLVCCNHFSESFRGMEH